MSKRTAKGQKYITISDLAARYGVTVPKMRECLIEFGLLVKHRYGVVDERGRPSKSRWIPCNRAIGPSCQTETVARKLCGSGSGTAKGTYEWYYPYIDACWRARGWGMPGDEIPDDRPLHGLIGDVRPESTPDSRVATRKGSPAVINGVAFPTKESIKDHARRILHGNAPDAPIVGESAAFLAALLDRHPGADEKKGCGVECFFTRRNRDYGQREFWLRRTDGSETDWSFYKCL